MEKHLESYKKLIGKKIQKRRIEMGFSSQELFAEKIGTDQSQVSRWESGKHIPEGTLRASLSALLEVNDDFFELVEITNQNGKAVSILNIQTRLTSLDESQLGLVSDFIDDILSRTSGGTSSNSGRASS